MSRPLLLLSNDDGFESPYLIALADELEARLEAEIVVVAPEKQQSATSHKITLHKPVRIVERTPGRFSVSGTPVDCVYIGLVKLVKRRPALVVSGVNDGYNLGFDVHYSGTVAAAREGALRGVPSLAVSLAPRSEQGLQGAIDVTCEVAKKTLSLPAENGSENGLLLNINVPAKNQGAAYRFTRLGRRAYEDDVHERQDPRGRLYYWIGGGIAEKDLSPGTDTNAVSVDGIASVTPLSVDPTATALLAADTPLW